MPHITDRAARATAWSAIEIASRYGVQFVVTVILARILSPVEFGLLAMLLVFSSIAMLFVDAGFGAALVQRRSSSADDETTVFIASLAIGVVSAALLAAGAPLIAEFFGQAQLSSLTLVMALTLPIAALASVPDAILTARLDFRARANAEIIASLVSGVVAIGLALQGLGVWSLVLQVLIGMVLRTALLWQLSGWRPRGRFRPQSLRDLSSFGSYLLLSGLLSTSASKLQSVIVGRLFNTQSLGLFSIAQSTQQAPVSLVGSLLNRIGLPVFSTVAHEPKQLLSALRASLRMAMFLFMPSMVGIAIIANPLIDLLYGHRWAPAAPILSILALGACFWPIHVLNLAAINALGRSDLFFRLEIVKQCIGVALILAFGPLGVLAVAWAVFAAGIFAVFINTYYARTLLGYGLFAQLTDQAPTMLLSCVVAPIGWAILHFLPAGVPATGLAIVVSAAVYLILARATRSVALEGLLSMARPLLPRPNPESQ